MLGMSAVWATVAAITVVTLAALAVRPATALGPDMERAGAFLLLGVLVALAYPKRWPAVVFWTLGLILCLEASQLIAADRQARIGNLVIKELGALTGLHFGRVLVLLPERRASKTGR